MAIDVNGKIVVAGEAGNPGDFALARYNADGSLDTTFNGTSFAPHWRTWGKAAGEHGSSG